NRLNNEGLFDPAHKQPLPRLPRRIGVITSPTGAAIRDILSVLRRRFPAIPVLIYPVPVQGAAAASQIARTIRLAGQRRDCDVLIVARGGGSLEDLWAFNEEAVARTIYDCPIPIVSGVGHEVDVTIADFAADHRAATPSAAAELVSPNGDEWLQAFTGFENRLVTHMKRQHHAKLQSLRWLETRLAQLHPARRLNEHGQRLDELEQRLQRACNAQLRHAAARSNALVAKLERHDPSRRLQQLRMQEEHLGRRLLQAMKAALEQDRRRLAGIGRALDAVSPLATLSRSPAAGSSPPSRKSTRHEVSFYTVVDFFLQPAPRRHLATGGTGSGRDRHRAAGK
ncbi:MAG: exodeoxyribonuclease VII large subunit, partial [Gammaproteobacteria bacterium]